MSKITFSSRSQQQNHSRVLPTHATPHPSFQTAKKLSNCLASTKLPTLRAPTYTFSQSQHFCSVLPVQGAILAVSCRTVQSANAASVTDMVILASCVRMHGSLGQTHRISLYAWGRACLGISWQPSKTEAEPRCMFQLSVIPPWLAGPLSQFATITANVTSTEQYKIYGQSTIQ